MANDLSPLELDAAAARDPLQFAVQSRDKDVLSMVRSALDEDRARLAFQPVVRVGHQRRLVFYEALIRILDEGGRVIPAGQFMGTVEDTALGRQIDCASLRLGLAMLRAHPRNRLSINTSARSLADAEWRDVLDRGLAQDEDLAARLIIEIGETSAMQLPEVVVRFMERMQPLGVAFALDDFGGGMTSFKNLKDFLFDLVKVDRAFTRGIETDPDNQVLAEALVTVAQQFEMFAVAQGVESEGEAEFLTSIGVDCLQGYHIGVPRFSL